MKWLGLVVDDDDVVKMMTMVKRVLVVLAVEYCYYYYCYCYCDYSLHYFVAVVLLLSRFVPVQVKMMMMQHCQLYYCQLEQCCHLRPFGRVFPLPPLRHRHHQFHYYSSFFSINVHSFSVAAVRLLAYTIDPTPPPNHRQLLHANYCYDYCCCQLLLLC